jgi:hypothetical protein
MNPKKSHAAAVFLILLTLLLSGCMGAAQSEAAMDSDMAYEESMVYPAEAPAAEYAESDSFSSRSEGYSGNPAVIERMVIRNANLSLVVTDPSETVEDISRIAEANGGYVISSNLYQTTYGQQSILITRGSISIRVLSESLDEALQEIKELALEVDSESVSGQDVTDEYTDLSSRLRNLEAAEEQLLTIMDSATETEDVLQIFESLKNVREEIEVLKGRMGYLEDSARLSQVSIELTPDEMSQPLQIGGWQPKGTIRSAVEALINALQFLVDAGIWFLICVIPVALILGFPLYFAFRTIIRKRRARKAEKAAANGVGNEAS